MHATPAIPWSSTFWLKRKSSKWLQSWRNTSKEKVDATFVAGLVTSQRLAPRRLLFLTRQETDKRGSSASNSFPHSLTSADHRRILYIRHVWRYPESQRQDPSRIQIDLTTLTFNPWRSLPRLCCSKMLYFVWSCSAIVPIWTKEDGSFSRNSRRDWIHQRLLWSIPWSLAHSQWP
jgi:hypothetical protein